MADDKATPSSSKTSSKSTERPPERVPGTSEHLGSDRPYEMPGQDEEESK